MNRNALLRFSIRCAGLYGAVCLLAFLFQRSLLFFPTHRDSTSSNLVPWINEGQTFGYCREVPTPENVWLMMHGNAGQASDREYVLARIAENDALYVLEYPGYGSRDGSPSKNSIDKSASVAYQLLRQRYPNTPVCVIGESIGSGPASMLAKELPPPEKIVLITPFDSLYHVASKRFWFLPVWLLLRDRWNNIDSLKSYDGQLDVYGATYDTVIPIEHAKTLARETPAARMIQIPSGHNDWSFSEAVNIAR